MVNTTKPNFSGVTSEIRNKKVRYFHRTIYSCNTIKLKHPAPAEVKEDPLLFVPINKVPNCYFNDIDVIMVGRAASLITCRF